MSEIGIPNSATYAQTLSGIEEMMTVLPDNTGNEISAQDMRNVVYTLFQDIQSASFSEFVYTDDDSTVEVGGMPKGQVFASMSLFTIFNKLFHKDQPPTTSLKINNTTSITLDYKVNQSQESAVTLTWTATKGTYALKTLAYITRPTNVIVATLNVPSTGTTSDQVVTTTPIINTDSNYDITVYDTRTPTALSASAKVYVNYRHKWYWGRRPNRSQLGGSSDITSLDGAGVSGNGSTGTTFVKIFQSSTGTALDPQGQYICFAWPSAWGTPLWKQVAGYSGWATKVQSLNFVNSFGYSEPYDVYISVEPYGTKLDYLEIQKSG